MCVGRLLKIFEPEYITPLWTIERSVEGRWRSRLCLVLRLWMSLLDVNNSLFSMTKKSTDIIYWEVKVSIFRFLKSSLQDSRQFLLVIILTILFWILKISLIIGVFPQNKMPYLRMHDSHTANTIMAWTVKMNYFKKTSCSHCV